MIDLVQPGEIEGHVLDALEDAKGFVHFEVILQSVLHNTTVRTHEVLEDLKSRGVVSVDDGNRWRLRKCPTTIMSIEGDPNFRAGDR